MIEPNFLKSKEAQIAVATTDLCNANCSFCIWPFMESQGARMDLGHFSKLLDRFEGYCFSEFALNVINEPFTDPEIFQKLELLAQRNIFIENLFFSSNWMGVGLTHLERFVAALLKCDQSASIRSISINATVSGIDEKSYNEFQGGSALAGGKRLPRTIYFHKTVFNILEAIRRISAAGFKKPHYFYIKAYAKDIQEKSLKDFWEQQRVSSGIPGSYWEKHVRIVLNHGFTSFARHADGGAGPHSGKKCSQGYLTDKLTVGAIGEVGLCCNEGLRQVVIGNLAATPLTDLVFSENYQRELRIVTGAEEPSASHPCAHCEFYAKEADIAV